MSLADLFEERKKVLLFLHAVLLSILLPPPDWIEALWIKVQIADCEDACRPVLGKEREREYSFILMPHPPLPSCEILGKFLTFSDSYL